MAEACSLQMKGDGQRRDAHIHRSLRSSRRVLSHSISFLSRRHSLR